MNENIQRLFSGLKMMAYIVLFFMLYSNLIGPEGVAQLLKVEEPSEEGLKQVGLLIPEYVLYWTLGTVALEVIANAGSFLKLPNHNKSLKEKEFSDAMYKRDLEKSKITLRVAKIEGLLKDKED